jgi:two-component system, OmpR family, response regulator ChvI
MSSYRAHGVPALAPQYRPAQITRRNVSPGCPDRSSDFGTPDKPQALRVILVDDDEYFREMVSAELAEYGFSVQSFADSSCLRELVAAAADADVVVLDWGLPRMDGIDLLSQLKRLGVNLPVVFLTGRALPAYEGLAFDRGAIDFIDKARGVPILIKRLRLAVDAGKRLPGPKLDKVLEFGGLLLRPLISRAYWNSNDVDLTLSEYNIVHMLATNVGQPVTYREIYDCVHYAGFIAGSGDDGYRTNVRSAIKRIRNKFRASDPSFDRIENYTAFGYGWRE